MKSCCELYQYKVRIDDVKMTKSQKQTMKRFHRYLNTGSVNVEKKSDGKDQEEVKKDDD